MSTMRSDMRALIRTLRDDRVWAALDARPVPSSDVRALAQLIFDENADAAALLDDILTGPRAWWPQRLRRTPGAMTAGMVQQLLRRMMEVVRQCPEDALQITSMARMVADALDVDDYPYAMVLNMRAQALRDHGSVLSFMHRFPEALEVIERAERAFEDVPFADYDAARLRLVKALALRFYRPAEAAELARETAETFLFFGDRSRSVMARTIEAGALYLGGAVEQAMEIWQSLQETSPDHVLRLTQTINVALCLVRLGRGPESIASLDYCLVEFEKLGMRTEQARARWTLGNALRGTDRQAEAMVALGRARDEFAALSLPVDAALAALDLADALLVSGQPEQVPAICREAIAYLTDAGLTEQALPGLALLREAAAMGKASRVLIRETHERVRRVVREERLLFVTPPGGER